MVGRPPVRAGDQADAGGIETGIQRGESLREAVEAEARVVDQVPGEHLCQVQPGQLHARGDDGLECGQLRSLPAVQREGLVAGAVDVAAAEIEAVVEAVIDLYEEVVAVEKIRDGVDVVGADARIVLVREEAEQARAEWILGTAGGEVCRAGGGDGLVAGHAYGERRIRAAAFAFVGGENERPVVLDGGAEGAAEIAVLEGALLGTGKGFEEIAGVQLVVAQVLVGGAVNLVGAGLEHGIYNGAGVTSVLGRSLRLNAELGERIHRQDRSLCVDRAALVKRGLVAKRVVVIDSVDQEDVRLFALAVHREGTQRTARRAGRGAGDEKGEFAEVAAVERQLVHLPVVDDFGEVAGIELQDRRRGADRDGLVYWSAPRG